MMKLNLRHRIQIAIGMACLLYAVFDSLNARADYSYNPTGSSTVQAGTNSGKIVPQSTPVDNSGTALFFAGTPSSAITRPANTTTYTTLTGWCNTISTCSSVFTFTGACRVNGGSILIPEIDIYSSANPSTTLQGVLYLFSASPGTVINDNAPFTIASADFANVIGPKSGLPITLSNQQATVAANSSASLTGINYQATCGGSTTTIYGMFEVVNPYTPASGEVLTIRLSTIGLN